jgi:hypothetical protein
MLVQEVQGTYQLCSIKSRHVFRELSESGKMEEKFTTGAILQHNIQLFGSLFTFQQKHIVLWTKKDI